MNRARGCQITAKKKKNRERLPRRGRGRGEVEGTGSERDGCQEGGIKTRRKTKIKEGREPGEGPRP